MMTGFLLPVEVAARKKGTAEAPETGLIVKKGDVLEFALNEDYFDQDKQFENLITWEFRRLKGDGSYTAWAPFGAQGKGTKFEHTTSEGGIYQLRIEVDGSHVDFVRDKDIPNIAGSDGVPNPELKAGKPDFVGVYDGDWQKRVRDQALSHLGETKWSKAGAITGVGYGVDPTLNFRGSWKCNILLFMQANDGSATVPTRVWRDCHAGLPPWTDRNVPPTADEWEDSTVAIAKWRWLSNQSIPQPGFAVSRSRAGSCQIGILDYDGTWINAGRNDINKSIYLMDGSYQPAKFIKYIP